MGSEPTAVVPSIRATIPTAIRRTVAKENSRYAINGVHVRAGPTGYGYAATTNGRMLVVREIEAEATADAPPGVIVPADLLGAKPKNIGLSIKAGKDHAVIAVNGERIDNETAQAYDSPVEGSFPPIADVIPEWGEDYRQIAFDVRLLSELAAGMDAGYVTLAFRDPGKPIVVLGSDRDRGPITGAMGVLMPVTGREDARDQFNTMRTRIIDSYQGKWAERPPEPEPNVVEQLDSIEEAAGQTEPDAGGVIDSKPPKPGVVPDEELEREAVCDDERGFLGRHFDDMQDQLSAAKEQNDDPLIASLQAELDRLQVWFDHLSKGSADPATMGWGGFAEFNVPVVEDARSTTVSVVYYPGVDGPGCFELRGPIADKGLLQRSLVQGTVPEGRTMTEHARTLVQEARADFVAQREKNSRKRGPRPKAEPAPSAPVAPPALPAHIAALVNKYAPKPATAGV